MKNRTSLQKTSDILLFLEKLVVVLLLLNTIIATIVKPVVIKVTHILFDNDYIYLIYSETKQSLAETSVDLSNMVFKFIPEIHTKNWGENLDSVTSFIGIKLTMYLLGILTFLIIGYIVSFILRSHKGEMKPLKNDLERKKLKKGIRQSTNSEKKDMKKLYKQFAKTDKELKFHQTMFKRKKARIYKYGSDDLISKLIYVETFRKAEVNVFRRHDEGSPRPEKTITVIVGNPNNINARRKVFSTVKEFHSTLVQLTKVTFDQYVQPKERGEYTFNGSVEIECKDTRLVKKNNGNSETKTKVGLKNENEETKEVEGNFPLELLVDRTKTVAEKTKKAEDLSKEFLVQLDEYFSSSDIQADMIGCTIGKSVISYDYRVRKGKIPKNVSPLVADLKFYLDVKSVTVVATGAIITVGIPIPKKDMIPIDNRKVIGEATSKAKNPLDTVLGIKQDGKTMLADIAKAPHFLISGATGQGKSVGLNYILTSISHHAKPFEFELALLDPKRVEFAPYKGHPCNIVDPIKESEDCVKFLKYAVITMNERYKEIEKNNCVNILTYNEKMKKANKPIMKHMLIVIDELAKLMKASKDTESCLESLAQEARASGIHVLVATQRPSVDVITGTIKNNFLTRLTYKLQGATDSRTALGGTGAERLNGAGDSLLSGYGYGDDDGDYLRLQGGFLETPEVESVVSYLKDNFKDNEKVDYKTIVKIAEGEESSEEDNSQFDAVTSYAQTRQDFQEDKKLANSTKPVEEETKEDSEESTKKNKVKTFSQSASEFNVDPSKMRRNKGSRTRKYVTDKTEINGNDNEKSEENNTPSEMNSRKTELERDEKDKIVLEKAHKDIESNSTQSTKKQVETNTRKTEKEMGDLDKLILNKAVEKVKERQERLKKAKKSKEA